MVRGLTSCKYSQNAAASITSVDKPVIVSHGHHAMSAVYINSFVFLFWFDVYIYSGLIRDGRGHEVPYFVVGCQRLLVHGEVESRREWIQVSECIHSYACISYLAIVIHSYETFPTLYTGFYTLMLWHGVSLHCCDPTVFQSGRTLLVEAWRWGWPQPLWKKNGGPQTERKGWLTVFSLFHTSLSLWGNKP